ncbi:MAG: hypothetical protein JWM42_2849 [Burkholderia sp.]|jgi:hypothetical protein|nr:hypothetical protein [Burkholderia sp.]
MILTLHASGSVELAQPDDFRRFHCEIDMPQASLAQAQLALAGIAQVESRETAWVDVPALLRLGQAHSSQADWAQSANAMIEMARKHGWVRDQPLAVKSHIVWRP